MLGVSLQNIEDVISQKETDENVNKLKSLLSGADIEQVKGFGNGMEMIYVNLAGLVFREVEFKPRFLNCVLDVKPQLLMQEYKIDVVKMYMGFGTYDVEHKRELEPPLCIAIKKKNPAMVNAILSHSAFLAHRKENVENNCIQLIASYMNLIDKGLQQGPELMMESHKVILQLLLNGCKASMREAGIQDKKSLPEATLNMYGMKDWRNQPIGSLDTRTLRAKEICMAFFSTKAEGEEWVNSIKNEKHGHGKS